MVSSGSESAPWEGARRGLRAGWVSLAGLRGGPTPILGCRAERGRSSAGPPAAGENTREPAAVGQVSAAATDRTSMPSSKNASRRASIAT